MTSGISVRQLRVGEELRHALVRVFGHARLADPDLAGVSITVTEVKVSPDLRSATVFVTPLGGAGLDETVSALNRAAGYLRGQLGRELTLRHTPRIDFSADRSFDHAMRVREILAAPRGRGDLEPGATEAPPHEEDDGDGA